MSDDDDTSRFSMELSLLHAMYPDRITYDARSRDLKYSVDDSGAALQLRIPEAYPEHGVPDVLSARDARKNDVRTAVKDAIKELGLAEGEEALDAIVAAFQGLLDAEAAGVDAHANSRDEANDEPTPTKTVVIWLHHLLALSKRKLALSPTSIAGITKPGYPGVMIFSGNADAVSEHVNTLKAENWQAFQVRYEEEGEWEFEHGKGVREVETMGEVVKGVVGEERRGELLRAVGIK